MGNVSISGISDYDMYGSSKDAIADTSRSYLSKILRNLFTKNIRTLNTTQIITLYLCLEF